MLVKIPFCSSFITKEIRTQRNNRRLKNKFSVDCSRPHRSIQGTNFLLGPLPYDKKEMLSFISFNNSQIEKYGGRESQNTLFYICNLPLTLEGSHISIKPSRVFYDKWQLVSRLEANYIQEKIEHPVIPKHSSGHGRKREKFTSSCFRW